MSEQSEQKEVKQLLMDYVHCKELSKKEINKHRLISKEEGALEMKIKILEYLIELEQSKKHITIYEIFNHIKKHIT